MPHYAVHPFFVLISFLLSWIIQAQFRNLRFSKVSYYYLMSSFLFFNDVCFLLSVLGNYTLLNFHKWKKKLQIIRNRVDEVSSIRVLQYSRKALMEATNFHLHLLVSTNLPEKMPRWFQAFFRVPGCVFLFLSHSSKS